jgi:hypothetical protein
MLEREPFIALAAGQLADLLEAPRIDQPGDALADGEAALVVLALDIIRPALRLGPEASMI